ncbi:GNAT family N-acetyltransferase [Actinoplanes sp. TBRC 11911]|uniref:GNAT family N-acetyltransferase n=1 Tax=Actinoplanes sp. TBRC 11911 TaxID=2729386 RepID=UPI00145E9DE0|nr:GNAT family N-acetyltransferase [Actinoplanes sp. TBRC 11911]NMO55535.1 GNAT family N-acetyltransferase [Actinoplanes sp. TBRC 11911]
MPLTTRRADNSDAELLHDLAARTFGLACPPGTLVSDVEAYVARNLSREAFVGYLADPGRVLLTVSSSGVPIGYSMLVSGPITDPVVAAVVDEKSIELSKFYVDPGWHGAGAAAELMTATLAEAAATGADSCWLGVNQQNVRAARFYAKQGFEVVGVRRFQVGDVWHDDHVRSRRLP